MTDCLRDKSLDFLESLGSSDVESLLLTPAIRAFPTEARFKDWRIELRVVGLEGAFGLPP